MRSECHLLFEEKRYTNADIQILKFFFLCPANEELRPSKIKRFDADKFKPLQNFLKLGLNTNEKNVEILAWLIDFKNRPYSRYIDIVSKDATGLGLSSLKVLKTGAIIENSLLRPEQEKDYGILHTETVLSNPSERTKRLDEYGQTDVAEHSSQKITLEYPSGVKIKVDTSDLRLIAQLVKL